MSRQGIDLDCSTLAGWVDRAAFELRPVFDALGADLKRLTRLFMDETRAPVIPVPAKPRPDTSGRWLVMTDSGAEVRRPLGEALAYIVNFWGPQCIPDLWSHRDRQDSVERTIRPIALNRKNALFAGHDAGAENWAIIAPLIETGKLNAVDPFDYMAGTFAAIVNGHMQNRIHELLPRNSPQDRMCQTHLST